MKIFEAYLYLIMGILHLIAGAVFAHDGDVLASVVQYVGGLGWIAGAFYMIVKIAGPQKV